MPISPLASRPSHLAACLVVAAVLFTGPAASAKSELREVADEAGLGLAAASCTILYAPIKVFVSATGFLVGGTAWAVTGGDREPALEILERTGGGDWIVTQQHLRGDRPFYVLARDSGDDIAQRE